MEEGRTTLDKLGQRNLLADQAYQAIRSAILGYKLPPGTALSVPKLASQLAISRSPVREAVQWLVRDELAMAAPHRETIVARIGLEDLLQLYEMRGMLEGLAARLATEKLDISARGELESIVEQHRKVLEQGEGLEPHVEVDIRFHRTIREIAGNQHLVEALDRIQEKVRLAMHSLWWIDNAPHHALEDHEKILATMFSGDPDATEMAARAHIARLRTTLAECMEHGREEKP